MLHDRELAFLLGGHTHRRRVRRVRHLTVLNAGTLRRGDAPCVMLADFEARTVEFYDLAAGGVVSSTVAEVHHLAP